MILDSKFHAMCPTHFQHCNWYLVSVAANCLLMKMWIGRDSVIQLNSGESWTLFMLLFDFGCQMMSPVLSMLKWRNIRN